MTKNPDIIKLGFVIPGSLEAPTGGTRYDREVLKRLPAFGILAEPLLLSGNYPRPSAEDRVKSAQIMAGSDCDVLLIDGLAFGVFTEVEFQALTKPYSVLLHHPLADETGLDRAEAQSFYEQEKANLRHAGAVIVTSASTKERLNKIYDVKNDIITFAEPAVATKNSLQVKSPLSADRTARMLSVGAISPRKNYGLVLKALSFLTSHQPWIWQIAGRLDDEHESTALKNLSLELGLSNRVEWLGSVSETFLAGLYQNSDFLLFPSCYEGYGMALDESLSFGVPVLASDQIPSANKAYGAAVKRLDPQKPEDWKFAIEMWLNGKDEYLKACKSAVKVMNSLPDWDQPTGLIAESIRHSLKTGKGIL